MSDSKVDRSEENGLVVIVDDEANLLTFEWDSSSVELLARVRRRWGY